MANLAQFFLHFPNYVNDVQNPESLHI